MKRPELLILAASLLASSVAHADCQGFLAGLTCMSETMSLWSLSTLGAFQDPKEAYIAELKDEAVNYVASDDGAPVGAVLQDAISQVRISDSSARDLSDRDLALLILKSN